MVGMRQTNDPAHLLAEINGKLTFSSIMLVVIACMLGWMMIDSFLSRLP